MKKDLAPFFFGAIFSAGALLSPWVDEGASHWKAAVHIGLGMLGVFALGLAFRESEASR